MGRFRLSASVLWALSFAVVHPDFALGQFINDGDVETIEEVIEPTFHEPDLGEVWASKQKLGREGANSIRLHFVNIELPPNDVPFAIVITRDTEVLERFDRSDLEGRSELWSQVLFTSWVKVRVRADAKPVGLHFRVDLLMYTLADVAGKLSLVGNDGREELYEIDDLAVRQIAGAVVKLSYRQGRRSRSCTAFLISANRLVTNEHCVADQETCETATALFKYQSPKRGRIERGPQVRCSRFIDANPALDYSLLELEGRPGEQFGYLELDPRDLQQGEDLILVQHPGGKPKEVSRKGCFVKTPAPVGEVDFGHACDTEEGSSGSPLLSKDLKVVGVHHLARASSGRWADQNRAVSMQVLAAKLLGHAGAE